jgi:chaperonin GroES
MSNLKFSPLGDRVAVEPKKKETTSAGGIVIPDTAGEDKPVEGTIVAVGKGKCVEGKIQPLQVKPGDRILFGKYAGTSFKLDGKDLLVMREEDVMGVLE